MNEDQNQPVPENISIPELEKAVKKWLKDIKDGNIDTDDLERSLRYARDLENGLRKIRTYPQGVSIFGSARLQDHTKWYQLAEKLGAELAYNGHPVITGGGPAIMEAANKGSYEAGGRTIGLCIKLEEEAANPYLTDFIEFNYFFARKVMLTFSSKVFVFFPGGFGTLDEFSEIITLMKTDKMPQMPMFLIGKSFWKPFDSWIKNKMVKLGTAAPNERSIYKITDDINEVVKAANKIGHPKITDNLYNDFSYDKDI